VQSDGRRGGVRRRIRALDRAGIEPRRVRVEAEADLASPLLDEGGKPVRERLLQRLARLSP